MPDDVVVERPAALLGGQLLLHQVRDAGQEPGGVQDNLLRILDGSGDPSATRSTIFNSSNTFALALVQMLQVKMLQVNNSYKSREK